MSQSHVPNTSDSETDALGNLRGSMPQPPNRHVVAGSALLVDLSLLAGWIIATDWLLFRIGTFLTWGLFFLMAVSVLASVGTLRRLASGA